MYTSMRDRNNICIEREDELLHECIDRVGKGGIDRSLGKDDFSWRKKMMIGGTPKGEVEDFAIIAGLIVVQVVYAGNTVVLSYLMSVGLQPSSLIVLSTFATFLVLSPLAIYFERSKWPKKFSSKLLIQLVLISFGSVTLFQSLFLKGIKLTSPAMATAMPNLAPGLIFVIAWAFRLEKIKFSCIYSKVKIVGTLLCVIGAIIMSFMQSTTTGHTAREAQFSSPSPPADNILDTEKLIGCMYLVGAVFVLSSNVVLQAITLAVFPAPMSLCAITSLIGVIITGIVQLIEDHRMETGWPLLSVRDLIGFSLLAGAISGGCISFNGWAMKKRGPVMVSMFSPISTVISVIFSVITLGESISLGSLAGMFLMFTGLYFVLWAKGKEDFPNIRDDNTLESEYDVKKPLLS